MALTIRLLVEGVERLTLWRQGYFPIDLVVHHDRALRVCRRILAPKLGAPDIAGAVSERDRRPANVAADSFSAAVTGSSPFGRTLCGQ